MDSTPIQPDQSTSEKEDVKIMTNDESTATDALQVDEFEDNSKIPRLSYLRIYLTFVNHGARAWGGPVAQIANLQEAFVIQQKWITPARFNRVFGVYQILPGPEATELAMFFGYNVYFNASFRALQPIVAAMVLRAVHKIGTHAFVSHKTKKLNWFLVSLAIMSAFQSALRINFFISLGIGGIAYVLIDRRLYWAAVILLALQYVGFGLVVKYKGWPSPSSLGVGAAKVTDPGHIFGLGLLAGSLSFGGAYTTIPFLKTEAVEIGKWLTKQAFLDAIAIGNVLPSPLVMFSTFLGFQSGINFGGVGWAFVNAVLITLGIFLPCFLFTILGHHQLERVVRNKALAAFFDGITGTVVGIIAITALDLLKGSLTFVRPDGEVNTGTNGVEGSQSAIAAVLYVLSLAALYSFRHKYTSLLLVILGAIGGQFLFVNE
ncbi:9359_t:CDS:2 [Paraglomus brasilianum]|uniref:9359_t:CDS:1 n=1 Tax=Paraglomus brasilianum TaxID=144538 RepID=A0A9N9CC28_9GLOM|nr:9359_t:CDS:2 [Paraglomus brasilianum]